MCKMFAIFTLLDFRKDKFVVVLDHWLQSGDRGCELLACFFLLYLVYLLYLPDWLSHDVNVLFPPRLQNHWPPPAPNIVPVNNNNIHVMAADQC